MIWAQTKWFWGQLSKIRIFNVRNPNYSKRPKSEHVRISDRTPSFGCKSVGTHKNAEIRTFRLDFRCSVGWPCMFERSDFGHSGISILWTPKSERYSVFERLECPKSERLLTEHEFVRFSAFTEKGTFGFWTLTVLSRFWAVAKSGQKCPDFRQCLKLGGFENGTLFRVSEIWIFGFRRFTAYYLC